MKDQILAKIKSIIYSNADMPTENLEKIMDEIDVIVGFFETSIRDIALETIVKKASDNFDYVKEVVEEAKQQENINEIKLEGSEDETDKNTKRKD